MAEIGRSIWKGASTPKLEDIITEDGILCTILSSLTLIEAVRTSVLSSRWRHIWTHLTEFNFNAITVLDEHTLRGCHLDDEEAYNLTKEKTAKFIRSVDSILQQLQGATVDEFAIRHFLDKSHSHHLDAWIRFAVASKAKLFRLHLFRSYPKSWIQTETYEFPCHLLGSSSFIERMSLINCSFKLPCNFDGLNLLKKLLLIYVNVTEEDFNRILSNCSSTLTRLIVWNAPQSESIRIPFPLSQLEFLWVQNYGQLRNIEMNAVNLLHLDYKGVPVDFKFRQSSKLKDANICFRTEGVVHNLDFYLAKLSSSLLHLQALTLKISGVSQVADLPKVSSRFAHLTHLDWEWSDGFKMSLLHLEALLDVAPFLKELNLCLSERVLEQPPQTPIKFREMLHKHPHLHLKTAQLKNFYFDTWQIELAAYLLNNATELESMTIEKGSKPSWFVSKEMGTEILSHQVPANVKLVIL